MVIAGGAWGSLDTLTSPIVSLNSDEDETKNHNYDSDNPELLKEEINFNNNITIYPSIQAFAKHLEKRKQKFA